MTTSCKSLSLARPSSVRPATQQSMTEPTGIDDPSLRTPDYGLHLKQADDPLPSPVQMLSITGNRKPKIPRQHVPHIHERTTDLCRSVEYQLNSQAPIKCRAAARLPGTSKGQMPIVRIPRSYRIVMKPMVDHELWRPRHHEITDATVEIRTGDTKPGHQCKRAQANLPSRTIEQKERSQRVGSSPMLVELLN